MSKIVTSENWIEVMRANADAIFQHRLLDLIEACENHTSRSEIYAALAKFKELALKELNADGV